MQYTLKLTIVAVNDSFDDGEYSICPEPMVLIYHNYGHDRPCIYSHIPPPFDHGICKYVLSQPQPWTQSRY